VRQAELFTIGYGNRTVEEFMRLLAQYQIDTVCDVRSIPYSKRFPAFGRELLCKSLSDRGIEYIFLGDELGVRPSDPKLYAAGRASYEAMSKSEPFNRGLQRLAAGTRTRVIALLCAEKDPLDCHRAILIAPLLRSREYVVKHIDARGKIETQSALEHRLLRCYGLDQPSLFATGDDGGAVGDAYHRRGEELAYDIDAAYQGRSR
jgi:uncharacterized protein (DUF488 family)